MSPGARRGPGGPGGPGGANGPRIVADVELGQTVVLASTASVGDAARALLVHGCGAVLVGGTEAILTEHDIVRAVAHGRDDGSPAALIATPHPLAVHCHTTIVEALTMMLRMGVRSLVVVDDHHQAIGILGMPTALDAILSPIDGPTWLPALRLALQVSMSPGPRPPGMG
jgi:signal-transduction protein with cAMP-binding, CBS, and nucleotidyltransferase domain